MKKVAAAGLALGPLAAALMLLLGAPENISPAAWRTAAIALWMGIWWLTEAIPVYVTALLPLILFPLLGVRDIRATAAPYANPVIFLFLAGFMIALAMERWGLHRRIALLILRLVGTGQRAMVGGFMVAAAFLSMWISNTATAAMMLPIALSVVDIDPGNDDGTAVEDDRFGAALLLGVAYGASIGGLGTLIGTPPNALLAGYMSETFGVQIGFGRWMLVGVPIVAILLPICWLVLTRLVFRLESGASKESAAFLDAELSRHGSLSRPEALVGAVFFLVAALWMVRPALTGILPGLTDPGIAVMGAVALFVIPAGREHGSFLLDWRCVKRLPWGVLILFGGGLSLAAAIADSGLAGWIAGGLKDLSVLPLVVSLATAVAIVVFLTELTSNTATAATFLPVAAAFAVGLSQNPLLFAVPVALAASCAFMMPVATPPNAIVFGSGRISVARMARAGIWMNLIAIGLLVATTYALSNMVFGVEIGAVPSWATGTR